MSMISNDTKWYQYLWFGHIYINIYYDRIYILWLYMFRMLDQINSTFTHQENWEAPWQVIVGAHVRQWQGQIWHWDSVPSPPCIISLSFAQRWIHQALQVSCRLQVGLLWYRWKHGCSWVLILTVHNHSKNILHTYTKVIFLLSFVIHYLFS